MKDYDSAEIDHYLDERVKSSSSLILKYSHLLGPVTKLRIVDLGCGDGRAVQKMIDTLTIQSINIEKVFAVDVNPTLKTSDAITVIKSDLNNTRLQIPDNSVHIVYSLETIEHLINPVFFVREAHRILISNGIFVITTPNILAWYNRILFPFGSLPIHYEVSEVKNYGRLVAKDGGPVGHVRVFSPRAARELFCDNGFSVLEIKGLKFLFSKDKSNHGKLGLLDSFFTHFPSFSSMFSIIGTKVG